MCSETLIDSEVQVTKSSFAMEVTEVEVTGVTAPPAAIKVVTGVAPRKRKASLLFDHGFSRYVETKAGELVRSYKPPPVPVLRYSCQTCSKVFQHMPALVSHGKACSRGLRTSMTESSTAAMLRHRKEVLEADSGRHIYVSIKVSSDGEAVHLTLEATYSISVSMDTFSQRSIFVSGIREFLCVKFHVHDVSLRSAVEDTDLSLKAPITLTARPAYLGGVQKRKRYSNEEKADAIHTHDENLLAKAPFPVTATSVQLGIPVANISAWANGVRDSDKIPWRDIVFKACGDSTLKRLKITRKARTDTARYQAMERQLATEIRQRRARGRKVGPRFLSVRGRQLVKELHPKDTNNFHGSRSWRLNFLHRNGFSNRKRTHKKSKSYASMGRFRFQNRFNVDQVPLPFVVGDFEHTIDDKGAKDVWIRQPGSGLEKRQATLQICIRAGKTLEGKNLPQPRIAILFRGTGKRISEAEKTAYHPDVDVYWQKCAWVDRPVAIEWQNGTLIPFLNEHLANEESVVFADNLDAQIQPEYLENQKVNGRALGWSLLKDGTFWSQPIDLGLGREIKRDVDYVQDEWLEEPENLEKWEGTMSASDRRILMTHWAGCGYKRTCERISFDRYFAKSGCKLTVTGEGDNEINPEGLSVFTFDRLSCGALVENPVQGNIQPATHAEMEAATQVEELEEEREELSEEGSDDNGDDEAERFYVPDGYTLLKDPPAEEQLNFCLIGWHVMYKWNGVGWCHGWIKKFYPKHRRGYNFEVLYEDGDRRDHTLVLKKLWAR
ncbi:hypothetical protein CYMTET_18458 [Cymbomonas tetramitiformis]|uniref:C2H2-type domain-containing protein n=1 Tax=Cymbomonas tetramitiformis TaxID=36881 RepID=A0AAE0G7Z4_9CHLO|nr:hypothetical protein CYMTET_18458 [Cymbomonas tetramitiformis]